MYSLRAAKSLHRPDSLCRQGTAVTSSLQRLTTILTERRGNVNINNQESDFVSGFIFACFSKICYSKEKSILSRISCGLISISDCDIKLSWRTNTDCDGYYIYRSKSGGSYSKGTGYEIQYAKNSSFTSAKKKTITKYATVKATLSSLTRNKTYYVRIRTRKKAGTKIYTSAWSASKKLKVTK